MSSKAIALMCIIFCFTEIFPPVNSNIVNNIFTKYEEIREYIDKVVNNVTRVRTTTELQLKGNELATLDFIGLVQQYEGYKAEEYDVETEDGYILKLHRISSSPLRPEDSNKPVVYMQHALVSSTDIFVIFGPTRDLAFLLADAGYDVWMGNTRGTTYSKRHVKYSSASNNYKFWNFNLDDVAMHDVPTFIDTVLEKTNKTKLTYIGYSMGTTLNFMLLSSKPEYNNKIDLSISLAPSEYFLEPYPPFLRSQLPRWKDMIIPALRALRYYEVFPLSKLYVAFAKTVCTNSLGKVWCAYILNNSLFAFQNVDLDTVSSIYSILFNGASLDVVTHYTQLVSTSNNIITKQLLKKHTKNKSEKFQKFDFGTSVNQEKYNSSEPPEYDLSKVTAPQAIFYADLDSFINPKGVEKLKNQLKNVVALEKVPKSYRHIDIIWAKDARIEYYYKVLILDLFLQVSSNGIISNIRIGYKRIQELSKLKNVTRIRTTAELHKNGNEFAILDFIGLVQQYDGYKAEEYDVQTEDGYILKLHRISNSPVCPKASNKPVVFMQHSLAANSDAFVILGPKHDLAFLLADACYDVWFGNARGTTYSKRHIKYSPKKTNYDFWKFNLDDKVMKDLPTFIDTVLEKTNKTKLTYIGFALGNTLSYMLLSSKPEYNDKINLSISLSPFGYFIEPYSLWFYSDLVLAPLIPVVRAIQLYELLSLSKWYVAFAKTVCAHSIGKYLCALMTSQLLSVQNVDINTMSLLHSDLTNGASLDEVEHITQLESKKKLIKFDFGPRVNQEKYNSSEPPEYDLSKITTPQAIFYADRDTWVNPKAAEKLKNDLKNVVAFEKVPESYLTYDFIWAKNAKIEYYYKVLNLVKKYT